MASSSSLRIKSGGEILLPLAWKVMVGGILVDVGVAMVAPLLLLTPTEQRSPDGDVTVTPSSSVEVRSGAWWLARGVGDASLLLSPDGSYDANGPVEPVYTGSVPVTDGRYGQAWDATAAGTRVASPTLPGMFGDAIGTILIRLRPYPPAYGEGTGSASFYALTSGSASVNRVDLMRSAGGRLYSVIAGTSAPSGTNGIPIEDYEWTTVGVRWEPGVGHLLLDGEEVYATERVNEHNPPINSALMLGGSSIYQPNALIESALTYPVALPDAEIQRLSTMPRAWTWGPDGTLSAPLATAPASILLRTRSGETVTTHHIAGARGEAGGATVTHDGEALTVGTTGEVEVVGVLAFGTDASEADIEPWIHATAWTWDAMSGRS